MNKIQNIFNKSFGEYVLVILIAIIIVVTYYTLIDYFNIKQLKNSTLSKSVEGMEVTYMAPRWNRNQCLYTMSETIEDELVNSGFEKSTKDWNLYFPCAYDEITKEVQQMPVVDGAKYFILENCDEIVAKELLWKHIVKHYDYPIAKTLLPNSYILYDDNDVNRFKYEYDPAKIYIMKKNIQRQEGLKITNDKDEIINGYNSNGYVLAQELLQNPYIISGRKTNMRFYVLVVCKGDNMSVFVYRDGFMYYTKDLFQPGSLEDGPNITTGYIDRSVYDENPLTHEDLRTYLDDTNRQNLSDTETSIRLQGLKISEVYFGRIYNLIRQIFMAFVGKLSGVAGARKFNDTNTSFQMFGVDIAVDNKLNPMVMEVNKGPDLGAKDKRDSELKHGAVRNMFKVIGAIPMEKNCDTNYVKVLEVSSGTINGTSSNISDSESCIL